MRAGKYLALAHGFSIHFGFIKPPKEVNVFMVAPKGPGHLVRHQFSQGAGVPCLLAIYQDPAGDTKKIGLAYASGNRRRARRSDRNRTFPRGDRNRPLRRAVRALRRPHRADSGGDTKRWSKRATRPRWPISECCHEMKLIVDLVYEGGISGNALLDFEHGRIRRLDARPHRDRQSRTKERMKVILNDIQSGKFAKEWMNG